MSETPDNTECGNPECYIWSVYRCIWASYERDTTLFRPGDRLR